MSKINFYTKFALYFILVVGVCSCGQPESRLEYALKVAKDNRMELEKVLQHYGNDSLKYKAAVFLIENMPYHYAYSGNEIDTLYHYYEVISKSRLDAEVAADSLFGRVAPVLIERLEVRPDIEHVDSAYLVSDIDLAFHVWRTQPWGRKISFNTFCRHILPYRVGNERLSTWRRYLYEKYNPCLDSIRHTADSTNIVKAAQIVLLELEKKPFHFTQKMPSSITIGARNEKWRTGGCRELTDVQTLVMRALGFPSGCERLLVRGENNVAHYFNYLLGEQDTTYFGTFHYSSKEFQRPNMWYGARGKFWREQYQVDMECWDSLKRYSKYIPAWFNPIMMEDVTSIYAASIYNTVKGCPNIKIPKDSLFENPQKNSIVYVCMANRMRWIPIGFGFCARDTILCGNLGPDGVYRLAVCEKDSLRMLSLPFMLKDSGTVRFMRPHQKKKITLLHKYSMFLEPFATRMLYGEFQGSNDACFNKKDILATVIQHPVRKYNVAMVQSNKKYRYVRYYGPGYGFCNVAEIAFYDSTSSPKPLTGIPIGTPNNFDGDDSHEFYKALDGTYLTSFDYKLPTGGWVGLDLGSPKVIGRIVYTPRNRDNFINQGDIYELFYQDRSWISLGQVVAEGDSITYEVPEGALLYLKNLSRGSNERIFEYIDGKQMFR